MTLARRRHVRTPGRLGPGLGLPVLLAVGVVMLAPVTVTRPSPNADISAALACPATMTLGGAGTCTPTVANAGPATASKVAAGVPPLHRKTPAPTR